ncbi:hypothetical protein NC651_021147 [Populus alba x Populus x berolinensis]|nr:hypothetical protein NC651_021147 [Populus alba x Populus x berolinensis]
MKSISDELAAAGKPLSLLLSLVQLIFINFQKFRYVPSENRRNGGSPFPKQKVDEDKKEIHLWGERRGLVDGIFFYGVVEALSKVIVTAGGTLMVMFSAPVSNTIHSPSPFLSLSISISQHLPNLNLQSFTWRIFFVGSRHSVAGPKRMERGQIFNKVMKVDIPSETERMSSGGTKFTSGLQRQSSAAKSNCLCSPTSHAGSFRCRLHRAPSLQRTKSIDSASLRDSETKINTTADGASNLNTIEAQLPISTSLLRLSSRSGKEEGFCRLKNHRCCKQNPLFILHFMNNRTSRNQISKMNPVYSHGNRVYLSFTPVQKSSTYFPY